MVFGIDVKGSQTTPTTISWGIAREIHERDISERERERERKREKERARERKSSVEEEIFGDQEIDMLACTSVSATI